MPCNVQRRERLRWCTLVHEPGARSLHTYSYFSEGGEGSPSGDTSFSEGGEGSPSGDTSAAEHASEGKSCHRYSAGNL